MYKCLLYYKNDAGGQEMKQYAYIRVSTKEQNIDRQILALKPYQISKKNIYCDYQSGKDFERPAYQKLMKKLKKGDLLIMVCAPSSRQLKKYKVLCCPVYARQHFYGDCEKKSVNKILL